MTLSETYFSVGKDFRYRISLRLEFLMNCNLDQRRGGGASGRAVGKMSKGPGSAPAGRGFKPGCSDYF